MSESRVTAQLKKAVAERANGCCEYCRSQARFAIQPFSIEHIIPRREGAIALFLCSGLGVRERCAAAFTRS